MSLNLIRFCSVDVFLLRLGSTLSAVDGGVLEGTGCRLLTGLIVLIILFLLCLTVLPCGVRPGWGPPPLL